jgi:carbamoyl-phosphate synthase large subunit
MNILILSCGTRNKIIQYFKKALNGSGNVIATDMNPYAPAIFEADKYYIVPRITSPDYIHSILDICRKEDISGVLSLIDPELSLLAANNKKFAEINVKVIGSDYLQCERALNKMAMYKWCSSHGYPCAKSYTDKELFYADLDAGIINYPVFVKPVNGSASLSVSKVYDRETLEYLFAHTENLMIQEYLNGQEIGADVYIDLLSGEVVSIFTKKKLLMRSGETDKAISFKDEKLFDMIKRFAVESGYRGQIDIDIFEINGQYYISEVNPRFGGGYPHAYECGIDHMKLIITNLLGKTNTESIGQYDEGVVMMKYNEIMITRS